jgi:hypothetical protein
VLRRATLSAWGAWARGDIDLTLVRLAPDFQIELQPEWVAAGMRSSYEGYAGVRERAADQHEVWQRMEFIPQEIVDAGDVIVFSAATTCALVAAASSATLRSALSCGWSEA